MKNKKSSFALKVSRGICPKCFNYCEMVLESLNHGWFPIGYNCKCGFKKKAKVEKETTLKTLL